MKIVSLELIGFKRMALNQVGLFKITLTQAVQLILGTNGSGKSSLIAELSPLPANPADYLKEGSKTIWITHRGSSYVLKSWFSPSQKHSFEKDGEQLNDGGTVTVQKELVRQEFGITAEIHDLLIGRIRFTDLEPTKRRMWFTRLSDTSYDYALAVFQRLKDRLRDTSGALKLAKKRLVAEEAKVISDAEQEKLQREVHEIAAELNFLQAQRAPVERPSAAYQSEIAQGLQDLERLSHRLLRQRIVPPSRVDTTVYAPDWTGIRVRTFSSLQDVSDAIDACKHEISVNQELINKLVAEHRKIEETVTVLKRTGAEGVASLQAKRNALLDQAEALYGQRTLKIALDVEANPAVLRQALESVREQLTQIFSELPANEDKRYSTARLQELQQQTLAAKDERTRKSGLLTRLVGFKSHLEAHKNTDAVKCPQCSFSWHLGYSEEKYQQTLEQIGQGEDELRKQEQSIEALEAQAKGIREYSELYRAYMRITQAYPVLGNFWDHLAETGYVLNAPRAAIPLLDHFAGDLELEIQADALAKQSREVDALIKDAEQVGDASLAEQQLKLEEVTLHIEGLTARLNRAREQQEEYVLYRQRVSESQEMAAKIALMRTNLSSANEQMVEMLRREMIQQAVRHLQHLLYMKEETLSAVNVQKSIIADIQANISRLELEEEAAKMAVRELSPTEGLIAEGLLGFIRSFVAQMNNLIRKIWTYPLVVRDCGSVDSEGAELDYKFPMMVQSKENIVPDVGLGSTGQQEIVNLAFKVTAMAYLHLSEAPLYLDEFASSLDEAHRSSASATIKALMDQRPFTQLFMVSHYSAQYGALSNAEICVICPSNITVPVEHKYNQHVVIE